MTETAQPESASRPAAWHPALEHSRWLCQLVDARPDIIDWLIDHDDQPLDRTLMTSFLADEGATTEDALAASLRRLRQRVMAALVIRDLTQRITLAEVMETMTQLAEVTVNTALDFLHRQLAERFGEPLDKNGQPQRLIVLGMGKLGGRELNVSSDVDFIFVYPE